MKKIVTFPNQILRTRTVVVTAVDRKLVNQIKQLTAELMGQQFGAGLAATQLGFKSRFFGIKNQQKEVDIYINPRLEASYGNKIFPQITTKDGPEDFIEGCLSFPDLWGTVKRFVKIDVSWEEIDGKNLVTRHKTLEGFEAIVWQHEADHVDGILFVDLVKRDGGKFFWWADDKEKIPMAVDEILDKEKQ